MKNVHYQNEGLSLHIPTLTPESVHIGLMQGIILVVKHNLEHPDTMPESVKQANIRLLDLLSAMLPEEQQLEKIYKR
ncbi:hypothetical protein [Chitinophaga solisilvae]|uniref:hypothetical protein n=1 Tax=Chitinophaga solisilvae TaxID=1233460 RepID=UPI00136A03DD|nr:hypothetical protein [Chitinophaga solisilvae]